MAGDALKAKPVLLMMIEGMIVVFAVVGAAVIRFEGDLPRLVAEGIAFRGVLFSGITLTCLYYWDLYDRYAAFSKREIVSKVVEAVGAAALVLAVVTYALPPLVIGRGILLLGVCLTVVGLVTWRLALLGLRGMEERQEKILILGSGSVARAIAREVISRPHLGIKVHGFIDDDPALLGVSLVNPRVVGTTADLPALAARERIGRVVVALSERRGRLPIESLLGLKVRGTQVDDAASFYEAITGKILIQDLRPSWIVFSKGFRPSRLVLLGKRLNEFLLAVVGLALAAPIIVLLAILIRLDSPGPAFFRQERVGEGGRTFMLYKFRSMRVDAEAQTGPVWACADDPRVTRLGRWLRKLRLDELPQLWNVVRGDMSFVGPRPERPPFVAQLTQEIPYYSQRHVVKPGITGWAQVRYPYGNTVADAVEKLQYDLYYIKNLSIGLDLGVVAQTIKVVLLGRGAV